MLNVFSNFFFTPTSKKVAIKESEPVLTPVSGMDHPIKLKKWSDSNLPPLAWNRILLKLLPHLKNEGVWLYEIMNPSASYTISDRAYDMIQKTIFKVYKVMSK